MNWIDYCLAIFVALPILATIVLGFFLARNGKHALGKPAIHPLLFFTAKLLLFLVWALFCFTAVFPQFRTIVPF